MIASLLVSLLNKFSLAAYERVLGYFSESFHDIFINLLVVSASSDLASLHRVLTVVSRPSALLWKVQDCIQQNALG